MEASSRLPLLPALPPPPPSGIFQKIGIRPPDQLPERDYHNSKPSHTTPIHAPFNLSQNRARRTYPWELRTEPESPVGSSSKSPSMEQLAGLEDFDPPFVMSGNKRDEQDNFDFDSFLNSNGDEDEDKNNFDFDTFLDPIGDKDEDNSNFDFDTFLKGKNDTISQYPLENIPIPTERLIPGRKSNRVSSGVQRGSYGRTNIVIAGNEEPTIQALVSSRGYQGWTPYPNRTNLRRLDLSDFDRIENRHLGIQKSGTLVIRNICNKRTISEDATIDGSIRKRNRLVALNGRFVNGKVR